MKRESHSEAPLLGAVADDITGACDLADALVQVGLSTVVVFGVPTSEEPMECDAVVVALKSRSIPAVDAIRDSLTAASWLRTRGAPRIFFKYCSTFDSTPAGNIGPVADALLTEHDLGGLMVHVPAYPANERTLYRGYLFVGDVLLSESGMREHPLTPMTDANLVRVLGRQTPSAVGLLPEEQVRDGIGAIHATLTDLVGAGTSHVLADATTDGDISAIARAVVGHRVAGGSAAFGAAWGAAHAPTRTRAVLTHPINSRDHAAVLVGSASATTSEQVANFASRWPVRRLDSEVLAAGPAGTETVLRWARAKLQDGPVMVTADTTDEGIRAARDLLGTRAAEQIEIILSQIAVGLVEHGVRRLIVAGGETSGAVAAALNLRHVRVGQRVSPGVPWTISTDPDLAIAFKSGNFGETDFFCEALLASGRDGRVSGE